MADQISDVRVSLCTSSKYVTPFRLHYKQDGVEKNWDYIKGHDSIAILLYNKDRDVFPVVKQFRPAVYAAKIKAFTDGQTVDSKEHKGEEGMTLELCAGIMDKDKDVTVMAQAEVLEETGYKVPLESLKKITSFRNGVGVKGTLQTLFYAEVTDQMKVTSGGGLVDEGERIEVIELSGRDAMNVMMNEAITKPVGMMNEVGVNGAMMTLFYAEVTDQMKVSSGGGLVNEGEQIEVLELPSKDIMRHMMDENVAKPVAMMFAFTWFFFMKENKEMNT